MTGTSALDRDALYYPYIHITDVNWLKATLLCFPNVRRMIPNNYDPDDSEEIREFCDISGPRGMPLLTSVDLFSPEAQRAEENLLDKLRANDEFIRAKYSKARTVEQRHGGQWLALHPALGSAILAVKAISIANDLGLDIVTDSSEVHHTVVSRKEGEIFEDLIGKVAPKRAPGPDETVDDLAEIVITTNFDVSKLSVKQIAELLADGKDLRRFKDALIPFAGSIPPIKDAKEREKRLWDAAHDVTEEWEKYKKALPRFALDAIFESTEVKWPDLANSLILGGGAISTFQTGVGVGLGITLVSYAGLKVWRKYKEQVSSPFGYLSRIGKAQSKNQSFLVLPPIV
ncbi:MAG: hypothetical protein ABSD96_22505 [Candidatus Korobacteraceae bacterium]